MPRKRVRTEADSTSLSQVIAMSRRIPGAAIEIPIVYGSTSAPLGPKETSGATHKWSVYVKDGSGQDRDLSSVIKKVTFKLHESFPSPMRNLDKGPFELTEIGWGEFEILIKIFWKDQSEKPLQLSHFLRLYPNEDTVNSTQRKGAIIAEKYDEIVIQNPTEELWNLYQTSFGMMGPPPRPPGRGIMGPIDYAQKERESLEKLGQIGNVVESELNRYLSMLTERETNISQHESDLQKLERQAIIQTDFL
eukprot:Clim_evm12s23 gene=Clim_evmTU12s23